MSTLNTPMIALSSHQQHLHLDHVTNSNSNNSSHSKTLLITTIGDNKKQITISAQSKKALAKKEKKVKEALLLQQKKEEDRKLRIIKQEKSKKRNKTKKKKDANNTSNNNNKNNNNKMDIEDSIITPDDLKDENVFSDKDDEELDLEDLVFGFQGNDSISNMLHKSSARREKLSESIQIRSAPDHDFLNELKDEEVCICYLTPIHSKTHGFFFWFCCC
jgi:hypothetical protein